MNYFWNIGSEAGCLCRPCRLRRLSVYNARIRGLELGNAGFFGLLYRIRDLYLEIFFIEVRIGFLELFDRFFGSCLDFLLVTLVCIVKKRAVARLSTSGGIVEVIVVFDGLRTDVAKYGVDFSNELPRISE